MASKLSSIPAKRWKWPGNMPFWSFNAGSETYESIGGW
jgi:hypothetical protein